MTSGFLFADAQGREPTFGFDLEVGASYERDGAPAVTAVAKASPVFDTYGLRLAPLMWPFRKLKLWLAPGARVFSVEAPESCALVVTPLHVPIANEVRRDGPPPRLLTAFRVVAEVDGVAPRSCAPEFQQQRSFYEYLRENHAQSRMLHDPILGNYCECGCGLLETVGLFVAWLPGAPEAVVRFKQREGEGPHSLSEWKARRWRVFPEPPRIDEVSDCLGDVMLYDPTTDWRLALDVSREPVRLVRVQGGGDEGLSPLIPARDDGELACLRRAGDGRIVQASSRFTRLYWPVYPRQYPANPFRRVA